MSRTRTLSAVVAALALPLALAGPAAAAPSATAGLYGSQDPQFDGVFRQSLAILGLNAVGAKQSPTAVTWLVNAQCADGSFQEFRSDLSRPCDPVDLTNFSGPDTNATAVAAAALRAAGTPTAVAAAKRAVTWLAAQQNADGGWPYFPGSASDANSTGLALAALRAENAGARKDALTRGTRFLVTLMAPCGSESGGGLAFQPGAKPDASASSQGYLGITGAFPVAQRQLAGDPTCAKNLTQKVGFFLASRLMSNGGLLPSSMGTDPDYSSTVNALLGLNAAGVGKPAIARALRALRTHARDYALRDGKPAAGPLGLLMLASRATGADAASFGGVDLVKALKASERR